MFLSWHGHFGATALRATTAESSWKFLGDSHENRKTDGGIERRRHELLEKLFSKTPASVVSNVKPEEASSSGAALSHQGGDKKTAKHSVELACAICAVLEAMSCLV